MPLYEYVCQKCKRRTEVIQNVGGRPIRNCPHCGGKVKKAFSAPAILFKGSGFYITDYAKGKTEEKGASPAPSEKGESGKSESGKSESGDKPAEKTGEKKKETKETKETKGKKAKD